MLKLKIVGARSVFISEQKVGLRRVDTAINSLNVTKDEVASLGGIYSFIEGFATHIVDNDV